MDAELRALQRRYEESGSPADLYAFRCAAVRAGRPELAEPFRNGDVVLVEEIRQGNLQDSFLIPVPWRGTVQGVKTVHFGRVAPPDSYHPFDVRPREPLDHPYLKSVMNDQHGYRRCPLVTDRVTLVEPVSPEGAGSLVGPER